MAIIYRMAVPRDVGQIVELLLEFHITEWPDVVCNPDKIETFVKEAIVGGVIFLAEDEGRIVGSIGITADEWWFSDDQFLMEHWFYVARSHRKGWIAARLLQKAKEFQQRTNIPMVLGVFARRDAARKSRLVGRYFVSVGETYIMGMRKLEE